jgi:hypothetical protein
MTVIQSVDEVQVAGSTTAGADREVAGELSLCARGKGGCLLVAHVNPTHVLMLADAIGDSIQGVTSNSVDTFHASGGKCIDNDFSNILGQSFSFLK